MHGAHVIDKSGRLVELLRWALGQALRNIYLFILFRLCNHYLYPSRFAILMMLTMRSPFTPCPGNFLALSISFIYWYP